ncbi:MAG: 3-hydroxyacyl-CoA dehydrogenase family protein [Candidatus Bathyarchaeia archaeon]
MRKVAVIGFGTMGSGIAQIFAQAGYEVTARARHQSTLNQGLEMIRDGPFGLAKAVQKGKITDEQAKAVISRIRVTTDLAEAVKDADFVVETVVEKMEEKQKIFAEIDALISKDVILVSNTSSLSITSIASATKRPEKVAGMHFFNPVPVMKLVEVIKGLLTSDETVEVVTKFSEKVGKTPVLVNKDVPGFVANRIGFAGMLEAIRLYEENVSSAEDIDKAMKLGYNWPLGPLELADLIGLDVVLDTSEAIYKETGDPKYNPPIILKQMIKAGLLGRKTGKGFYKY